LLEKVSAKFLVLAAEKIKVEVKIEVKKNSKAADKSVRPTQQYLHKS